MNKYRNVITDFYTLQRQYHDEVQALHQGQAVGLERELAEVADESLSMLSYVKDSAQAARLKHERLEKEDWQNVLAEEAAEQTRSLIPPMEKLWAALEVPHSDIEAFLAKSSEQQTYTPTTLKLYEDYANRLEDRLPILRVLTRREQLKKKFETTRKKAADPSRLFTVDSSQLLSNEQELSGVCMELLQHDTRLKELIPRYEERFQELFMYNGRHYLAVIDADSTELKQYLSELVSVGSQQGVSSPRRSKYASGREAAISERTQGADFGRYR